MKPVMLALSTFRLSDRTIDLAIDRATAARQLLVVFVIDQNLARYLIDTEMCASPALREKCEAELLAMHEKQAREKTDAISDAARKRGIETQSIVRTGRFGLVCVEIAREKKPECIFTTRSKRPAWVKKMFGSPVDYLVAHAGCEVIEA